MKIDDLTTRFGWTTDSIASLTRDVGPIQARWKPQPDEWSILEVVNHLYDEERDDFRMRLDLTLHHPSTSWPPIDPQGWVVERDYNSRDLQKSLDNFLNERRQSVAWLQSLGAPDWESAHVHPRFGRFTAGQLMSSWLAHDLLHIRQLTQLHWQYLSTVLTTYSTAYAGEW